MNCGCKRTSDEVTSDSYANQSNNRNMSQTWLAIQMPAICHATDVEHKQP